MRTMYKVNMELGKINRTMRVSFNLVIQGDNLVKQYANTQDTRVISNFTVGGSEYLKLAPYPYIKIDISDSLHRQETWNSNLSVNLNNRALFSFLKSLKNMIDRFKIQNLFYTQSGKLYVNNKVAGNCQEVIRLPNKAVRLVHTVVPDEENKENEYEGIVLMINSIDYYSYLTYDELCYLYFLLSKIHLDELSIQAINTYILQMIQNSVAPDKAKPVEFKSPFDEVKPNIPETPNYPEVVDPSEIPEI